MPIPVELTENVKKKSRSTRIPKVIRMAVKKVIAASERENRYANYILLNKNTVTHIFMLFYYMMGRESDQSVAREVGLQENMVGRLIRQGNALLKSKDLNDRISSKALFAKYCAQFKYSGKGKFKLLVKKRLMHNAVRSKKVGEQIRALRTIDPVAFEYQPLSSQGTFNQTNVVMIGEMNVQQILSLPVEERIKFLRNNQNLISPELRESLDLLKMPEKETIECMVKEEEENET